MDESKKTWLTQICPNCKVSGIPLTIRVDDSGRIYVEAICISSCHKLFIVWYDVLDIIYRDAAPPLKADVA